jgi:CRISPR/Cas system-associated exonuclease Cas4 (RecB family)
VKSEIKQIKEKYGDVNLIDMVHRYMQEENQENQVKRAAEGRVGKFYPSSVGNCRRKIAYQMMGYPGKTIPGKNLLIMDNGTYFHNRMEELFERMNILIAPELKLKHDELRISGRSDAIIWNFMKPEGAIVEGDKEIELYKPTDDGEELVYKGLASDVMIVEFKSINTKNFEKYLPKTKPKKEHEMQLQLYFYLTGIREGLVYYENKNTQEQKYYHVTYDQSIIDEVISDIQYVIKHIDAGTLPPRDYQPLDFQCRYCDFRDICYPQKNSYNIMDLL